MPIPVVPFVAGAVAAGARDEIRRRAQEAANAALSDPQQAAKYQAAILLGNAIAGPAGAAAAGTFFPPPRVPKPQPSYPPIPGSGDLPFNGGQCFTTYSYTGTLRITITNPETGQSTTTSSPISGTVPGKVLGIRKDRIQDGDIKGESVRIDYQTSENGPTQSIPLGGASGPNAQVNVSASVSFSRTDGLPDDCGNPPPSGTTHEPAPGTPYPPLPTPTTPQPDPDNNPTGGPSPLPGPGIDFSPTIDLPEFPDLPDIAGGIGDILGGLGNLTSGLGDLATGISDIIDALDNGGSGSGTDCLFQATNLSEVLSKLNEIIELLEQLENGTEEPITTSINLDYVTEDNDGNRELKSQALSVVNPPSGVVQLFNQSAEIALTNSRLVRKIHLILGGNKWELINNNSEVKYTANTEEIIRNIADESYTILSNGNEVTQFNSKNRDNKDLLELLIGGNAVNYMRAGLWKYPTDVSNTIVDRLENPTGMPTKKDIKLHDQQDFNQWMLVQLDEILGRWHTEVRIKDTDLTQAGDQSEQIVLHSISDALTEILSQNITTNIYVKTLMNMQTKSLVEITNAKKEAICTNYRTEAILDYLGCEVEDYRLTIANLITLPTEDTNLENFGLLDFLNNQDREIIVNRFIGKQNLQISLVTLLQAASIIRGALAKRLPSDLNAFKQQVKNMLNLGDKTEEEMEDDWNQFQETIENGFPDIPGTDDTKPYGRDYDQRPKLERFKDNSNDNNNNPE